MIEEMQGGLNLYIPYAESPQKLKICGSLANQPIRRLLSNVALLGTNGEVAQFIYTGTVEKNHFFVVVVVLISFFLFLLSFSPSNLWCGSVFHR